MGASYLIALYGGTRGHTQPSGHGSRHQSTRVLSPTVVVSHGEPRVCERSHRRVRGVVLRHLVLLEHQSVAPLRLDRQYTAFSGIRGGAFVRALLPAACGGGPDSETRSPS